MARQERQFWMILQNPGSCSRSGFGKGHSLVCDGTQTPVSCMLHTKFTTSTLTCLRSHLPSLQGALLPALALNFSIGCKSFAASSNMKVISRMLITGSLKSLIGAAEMTKMANSKQSHHHEKFIWSLETKTDEILPSPIALNVLMSYFKT